MQDEHENLSSGMDLFFDKYCVSLYNNENKDEKLFLNSRTIRLATHSVLKDKLKRLIDFV